VYADDLLLTTSTCSNLRRMLLLLFEDFVFFLCIRFEEVKILSKQKDSVNPVVTVLYALITLKI